MRADSHFPSSLTGILPRGGRTRTARSAAENHRNRPILQDSRGRKPRIFRGPNPGLPPSAIKKTSERSGFTLIEVLATLLLLSITLPAIMYGFSISTQAAAQARHRSEAGALAESKLNELVASGILQSSEQPTAFDTAPNYQWTATVAPWGQTGQGVDATNWVQQLDVTVSWNSPSPQSITVTTLIYQSANATGTTGLTGGEP